MDIARLIRLEPGHYVVAVSGGVDSMVLMHLLSELHHNKQLPVRITVAHFDHGIRDDSHMDRHLVAEIAQQLKLPFVFAEGRLGPGVSEAEARRARYDFLRAVQAQSQARALITAHHHDDVVETAVLNLIRGTGRKGLSSLRSRHDIVRPLLHVPKHKLKAYAEANGLVWREDSTNSNEAYRRNYVRHSIIKKAKQKSPEQYRRLLALLRRQHELNHAIDVHLETILHTQPKRSALRRRDVIGLPYNTATELVAEWLRQNGKRSFNKWLIDRLTIAIKTAQPRTEFLLDSSSKVRFTKQKVEFIPISQ